MKHILNVMILSLLFLSSNVFGVSDSQSNSGSGTGTTSGANANADANSGSLSGAYLGLDQSDHSSTSIGASDLGDNVPSVFSAGVTAGGSNPCIVSVGGGAGWSGAGFNFARAYNDGECQVRESLRLIVAILPNSNDRGSQMLIRETACQSDIFWQSMERVYISTKDPRFLCSTPRPNNKPIAIRDREIERVVKRKDPTKSSRSSGSQKYNDFF